MIFGILRDSLRWLVCGFDKGGTGATSVTQEFHPPSYTQAGWQSALNTAGNLASQPYQQYQGQTTADMNEAQNYGLSQLFSAATQGTPVQQAGQAQTVNTLNGQYLNAGPQSNVQSGVNPLLGLENPWMNQNIADNTDNMVGAFNRSNASQNLMAARAGAFGSSPWQRMADTAQQGLVRNVGSMASQTRGADYQNQQQLAEGALNRDVGTQQFNQQQAQQGWQSERDRQMSANNLAPQWYQSDLNAGRAAVGVGDALQGYQQQLLTDRQGQFQAAQNAPYQSLQNFVSMLQAASGSGGGSMSATNNGGGGGWQQLLGLGLAGAGAYNAGQYLGG
jgi:hypothetical protein